MFITAISRCQVEQILLEFEIIVTAKVGLRQYTWQFHISDKKWNVIGENNMFTVRFGDITPTRAAVRDKCITTVQRFLGHFFFWRVLLFASVLCAHIQTRVIIGTDIDTGIPLLQTPIYVRHRYFGYSGGSPIGSSVGSIWGISVHVYVSSPTS